jgi:hypothetical protein
VNRFLYSANMARLQKLARQPTLPPVSRNIAQRAPAVLTTYHHQATTMPLARINLLANASQEVLDAVSDTEYDAKLNSTRARR